MNLNLGAGCDIKPGYVNVDARVLPGVDVVHDLEMRPWPFEDAAAEAILALDVFEHLDRLVEVMAECGRILKPGGCLTIRGPLPESPNLWADVTHRRAFVWTSFDHFDWSTDLGKTYRYGDGQWAITERRIEGGNIVFGLTRRDGIA